MTDKRRNEMTARYNTMTTLCERLRDEIIRNNHETVYVALSQFKAANEERLALGEALDRPECMITL